MTSMKEQRRLEIEQKAKKRVADLRGEAQAIARGSRKFVPKGVNVVHYTNQSSDANQRRVNLSVVLPLLGKIVYRLTLMSKARVLESMKEGLRETMRTVAAYEVINSLQIIVRTKSDLWLCGRLTSRSE